MFVLSRISSQGEEARQKDKQTTQIDTEIQRHTDRARHRHRHRHRHTHRKKDRERQNIKSVRNREKVGDRDIDG